MSISPFKIANKLITGPVAIERLATELPHLNVRKTLMVTYAYSLVFNA